MDELTKTLAGIGLLPDEAKIYLLLLESSYLPARIIASKTGIGRTLVYRAIVALEKHTLVERKEQKKSVTLFYPTHPSNLQKLIEQKEEETRSLKNSFLQSIGKLSSNYNALVGKPNVKFLEGIEGIQKVYNDIIEQGENVLVFSSSSERDPVIEKLMTEQIDRQIKKNIHTRGITPLIESTADAIKKNDAERLITRCIIPNSFDIPSQIFIYKNKVGIISFKNPLMSTVIENNDISETFKIIFEKFWKLATPESDKIKEKIELGHIR